MSRISVVLAQIQMTYFQVKAYAKMVRIRAMTEILQPMIEMMDNVLSYCKKNIYSDSEHNIGITGLSLKCRTKPISKVPPVVCKTVTHNGLCCRALVL